MMLFRLFADVGEDTAIDIEDMAVDSVGSMGSEEDSGSAEFFGFEPASRGCLGADEYIEGMTAAIGLVFAQRRGLRGSDIARSDTVALDVVCTVLGADITGQHLQSALRCCIGADGLTTEFGHHGADIDDFAFTALHHLGQHGRRNDIGSDEVHIDDRLELGALHLVHGYALDDTGIVDEDVDLSDLGMDAFNEGFDSVLVGDIAYIAVHILDARCSIVIESAPEGFFVDIIEDDVLYSGCDKGFCDVETDSITCACYPSVFSFQRKEIHMMIILN